jgi:transcription-repair coupling factor (superfamily II helicase)
MTHFPPPPGAVLWEGAADGERRRAFLNAVLGRPSCFLDTSPHPRTAWAFLALAICRELGCPVVVITPHPSDLDLWPLDLHTLSPHDLSGMLLFPPPDPPPEKGAPPGENAGERIRTIAALAGPIDAPFVLVTCPAALLHPVPDPQALTSARLVLSPDAPEPSFDQTIAYLERSGYRFESEVHEPGEATRRGGLLDVWPTTEAEPVRIEFFGSRVDAIRSFDPETQRSRHPLDQVVLWPVMEEAHPLRDRHSQHHLFECLPPETLLLWCEYPELEPEGPIPHAVPFPLAWATTLADQRGFRQIRGRLAVADDPFDFTFLSSVSFAGPEGFSPDTLARQRAELLERLLRQAMAGHRVVLFLETEGSLQRFLETAPADFKARVLIRLGRISEGFESERFRLTVAGEPDLYGRKAGRRPGRRIRALRFQGPISDLSEIEPGDLVVHADHGIGRYRGLSTIRTAGRPQEVLVIEYADGARLHVPVDHAHLVSRYVGVGRRAVRLHPLGGGRWQKDRQRVEAAIEDLAASMLEIQAARAIRPGHAFSPDTPWQLEFERAFPYRETEDQIQAIEAVKRDMESPRPMDRLICGDAGYGKTEVAMRAAFKAVMDGKQVAVLAPTTVLVQQHYFTFAERMAAFPVRIEMYSRLTPPDRRGAVRTAIASGACDIVIGTHGLLEPEITFKDLGLVIVDEEQRFGVAHKERLKQLRQEVDVLTLSATPIPRTLYLSLVGLRDLSLIRTPPAERQPIETLVAEDRDEVIENAIRRELARGGQVFFLHNRIHSIGLIEARLRRLVPEARLAVAHGRMAPSVLSRMMREFVAGRYDVLLCTTLVESGMDIPNANTILIERADRFGMAELYQLRGRVGRGLHRGTCILLLPRHGLVDPLARSRIAALRRHATAGAGFRIAMRDLELRGAGNLLGREQSGHIAAVGFSLYCQLLRRTVERLRGGASLPLPPAAECRLDLDFLRYIPDADDPGAVGLPAAWIEEESLKLAEYRRVASVLTEEEIAAIRREWRDRFGPLPPPAERLLRMAAIRIRAARLGFVRLETRAEKIHLIRPSGDRHLIRGRLPRFRSSDPTDRLQELLDLLPSRA